MALQLRGLLGKLRLVHDGGEGGFAKAKLETDLFVKTDSSVDGEACLTDCEGCSVKYPSKWSIDESAKLYGHVTSFHRHLIVATEKSDWVRDVKDIKGSVMEAIGQHESGVNFGKLMLSASNMPIPHSESDDETATRCFLLPAFIMIDNVTPSSVPDLIDQVINPTSTNMSPLSNDIHPTLPPLPANSPFRVSPCPHDYLILLCSHKTRDARCGQSAPLLRKEFERHLRPLGLMRDLHDERPGGVGIYFINHVGGHKFSANVMVYRRAGFPGAEFAETGTAESTPGGSIHSTAASSNGYSKHPGEAAQCIWLARVRPEDCENIINYTVLQGKVLKPESQLRGGFDRCKQLASW